MNKNSVGSQTYNLAVKNGADFLTATSCAVNAADEYAEGRYAGKVIDLIERHAKIATGLTGGKRLRSNKKARKLAIQESLL